MYLGVSFSRRERNTFIAGILLFALALPVFARNVAQEKELALAAFDVAERMREELNHRSPDQRTRRDYQHVADAYKRVYWDSPTCSKADASVFNMAGLLAEAGRRFNEPKTLKDAIAQYEFLRREYPGSKYRIDALFAIGRTYADLGDTAQAKAAFEEFLRRYPRSHMGEEARAAMASLEHPQDKQ
jgi:N-acetylmuramoyl-L-alanine amidase